MMIYTSSKVTIKQDMARIDKSIILYRGDRNVEIQFEIVQSPYRQYKTSGTNLILDLNASYGQLVVKKPDSSYIIGDVVPTFEGKVIFMIPAELIDEDVEVGLYDFQIRLYDESQSSRVTLPPVIGGIEIVEPIASEEI